MVALRSKILNRKFWHSGNISFLNFETVLCDATCQAFWPIIVALHSKFSDLELSTVVRPDAYTNISNWKFWCGVNISLWSFEPVVQRASRQVFWPILVALRVFCTILVALQSKVPNRNFWLWYDYFPISKLSTSGATIDLMPNWSQHVIRK